MAFRSKSISFLLCSLDLIVTRSVNSPSPEPVAIIGASGALGYGLAVRLGRAGVPVVIGSRDGQRANDTAVRLQERVPDGTFSAAENATAAAQAGIVILSVPFRDQCRTLESLRDSLSPGQLLIDPTVPLAPGLDGRATRVIGVSQGSAAQVAQATLPNGVKMVSALHTVSAASLAALDRELDQDVLVCGDTPEDKRRAARLLERIDGLRCVDCGPLKMARNTEPLTALLISISARYKTQVGVRVTGIPDDERW